MLKKIGIVFLSLILLATLVLIGLGMYFRSKASGSEFQPSGVNSHFTFDTSKPFTDYITYKTKIIEKGNLHYLKAKKDGDSVGGSTYLRAAGPKGGVARFGAQGLGCLARGITNGRSGGGERMDLIPASCFPSES